MSLRYWPRRLARWGCGIKAIGAQASRGSQRSQSDRSELLDFERKPRSCTDSTWRTLADMFPLLFLLRAHSNRKSLTTKILEARGVEPLSSSLSTQTSTCLSGVISEELTLHRRTANSRASAKSILRIRRGRSADSPACCPRFRR